jgi:hypothetical protein
MMAPPEPRRRYPLLGLVAYVLVPGERRVRAARHLRRAGVEVVRGVAALVTPERTIYSKRLGDRGRRGRCQERAVKRWISEKVPEMVRKELSAAVPAAMRAASHAGKEFLKKFSEEFPKERKKL